MFWFYIFALIPCGVGFFLWYSDKEVVIQEWIGGSAIAFTVAIIMHVIAIKGQTADIEFWNGYLTAVHYNPPWVERWIQTHTETYSCGTDSNGHTRTCTRTYTTTEYDHHPEHWTADVYLGKDSEEIEISYNVYSDIRVKFGGRVFIGGTQSFDHSGTYESGDQNYYTTKNETGFIYPYTETRDFENRIIASPSIFSFGEVSTNIPVFSYPKDNNPFVSEKIMGSARGKISQLAFDQMNARLGPVKKVNVILIGFEGQNSSIAEYQRAKFMGGKKNDLVLLKGSDWTRVFGWTEKEIVKANLETILLEHPLNDDILPLIEKEIKENYVIKDWKKFDYITIQPQFHHFVWFFVITIVTQVVFYIWAHNNEFGKYFRRWN